MGIFMNIVCDVILAGIFILTIFMHIRKGFVDSLLHTFAAVIAAVGAVIFGPYLSDILRVRIFGERFTEKIHTMIKPMFTFVQEKVDLSAFLSDIQAQKGEFLDLISRMGISIEELIQSFGEISYGTEEDIRSMARSIAAPVAETISKVSGYVLVFLGLLLALFLLRLILKMVVKLPVLRQTNRMLGALLGMICGFVYVWVICIVLGGILEYGMITDSAETFRAAVNGSFIYRFFSSFSLIELLSLR